jgi:hypothetical protein
MNSTKPLYRVPVPSTEFEPEAHMCGHTLRFHYYRDGKLYRRGIRFKAMPATRTRAERCCTPWHLDAYDRLIEVENSKWVAEIRADTQEMWRNKWQMHHYMIALDSAGCFEVIAEAWEILPEEPGTWA